MQGTPAEFLFFLVKSENSLLCHNCPQLMRFCYTGNVVTNLYRQHL